MIPECKSNGLGFFYATNNKSMEDGFGLYMGNIVFCTLLLSASRNWGVTIKAVI